MGFRRVEEPLDQRMPFERLLHDSPLDASPPAVNQADLAQARLMRGPDVFLDDGFDVSRLEGMQIQRAIDGDFVASAFRRKVVHSSP